MTWEEVQKVHLAVVLVLEKKFVIIRKYGKLKHSLKIVKVGKVINAVKVANVVGESLTALTPLI